MSTYTKHITQLSTDNDWRLDFDITITTPEEAFTIDDNQSIINSITNPVITYIEEYSADHIYDGKEQLRGTCTNKISINDELVSTIQRTGIKQNLTTGDTTDTNYLPLGFEQISAVAVKHDADGLGTVSMKYDIKFTGDTSYATVYDIHFVTDIALPNINVHNVPFTEMGLLTKEALVNGTVAIRTRMVINGIPSTISTFSTTTETANKLIITESDAVKAWELIDERYVPNNGFIGQFVARTLTGELHNISDDFSIENTDVELQIGVVQLGTRYQWLTTEDNQILIDENGNRVYVKDLGNDTTTWYSLGNFLVTKPEDDEVADNTTFEALDYATKFNIDFNADYIDSVYTTSFNGRLQEDGSVTLQWLAGYTCNQAGVLFGNINFTNSDFLVPSNQFTQGESCRDVMKAIAQIAFGWCRIGWDNKCYIDELQTVTAASDDMNVLTNNNYYSLTTQKEVFGPVNRVVIGMSSVTGQETIVEDEESIAANGVTDILIMDNPILYTPELRESLKESSKKLFGVYYSPLEIETPGHPWLIGNELINVQDMQGNSRFTYPFNRTINYTGHIKTKLATPAVTTQEKDIEYKKQLFKTVREIGIKVDAQEGRISTINSKTIANENGLSALTTRFENEITDTYSKTQIQEIINGTAEDGTTVTSVKTTAGTFDKNGLTIEQTGSLTKTNINSDGMIIYNTSGVSETDELLNVNSNGVDAKNIKVRQYLNIGSHSRMEDYTHTDYTQGTGVFWIGSDY